MRGRIAALFLAAESIAAVVAGSLLLEGRDASLATFTVSQTANPGYTGFVRTGQAALYKAFNKYHGRLPASVHTAIMDVAAKFNDQGSTKAEPEAYDGAYLCPVSIGSPAVSLFLDFDTGSSDLWVFSTETPSALVNRQHLYSPSKSKSATQLRGATWDIEYGDGTFATGDVWLDSVSIGGVTVKNQAVESARNLSTRFTADSANSGLLGLGFSSLNTVKPNKQQTWFDNVRGVLAHGLFTADLRYNDIGSYDFGFVDLKKHIGSVHYTSVQSSQGYWGITADGYRIGNDSDVTNQVSGIVDTGTSLILLDDDIIQDYYFKVPAATYSTTEGGWIVPCDGKMPDFAIRVGSYLAVVPGAYVLYAPSETRQYYCYGGLQSSAGLGINIFGDVFIKSQLVVFDAETGRVGFAQKTLPTYFPYPGVGGS
ncbi:aspartic endopeptidase Pep1, partial [Aureobasidium melanogenum]